MLTRMLPIALDGTLQSCFTVRSQDAFKCTPENDLKDPPNCTGWHTPSLHDCTLPSKLLRSSQAHSRACSQGNSQLHSTTLPAWLTVRSQVSSQDTPKYTSQLLSTALPIALDGTLPISIEYMLPCMLLHAWTRDLLSCRRQAPGGVRLGAYGRQCLVVGSVRCVACGRSHAAYVGRNHDVGWYYSLNFIFSAATTKRFHNASQSWCWQSQHEIPQER